MISILKRLAGWFRKPYHDHNAETRAKDFEQWGGVAFAPAVYFAANFIASVPA